MTHPERVADYLEHIADAIDRTLAVIGEAVTQLQKVAPEFVTAHPEVPLIRPCPMFCPGG